MYFDKSYLNHTFIPNLKYNGVGVEYKCSVCSIIAHKFLDIITFVNEKRWVVEKFTCTEYLIKNLLE